MTVPPVDPTATPPFALLAQALREEREKLLTVRNEIILCSGEFVGSFAGYFYYRFEVPDDLVLRPVDRITCSFSQLQPVTIEGRIVSVENQFVVVALPMDFGAVVPEIKCQWNYDDHLPPVIELLTGAVNTHPVAKLLLDPSQPDNALASGVEPVVASNTLHEQSEAVKKILQNRMTYLWGPARTGKTKTLAMVAVNYLKAGKSVLLVAPTARTADDAFRRILALGKELSVGLEGMVARAGLPGDPADVEPASFWLEYEVETKRTDKKKQLEEGVALLRSYWKTKVHQYLHEDFYTRLGDLRERTNENRKQLDKVRDEITALKETVTRAQNASVIAKLKKGFSKEDLAAAQKQLSERFLTQKRLQPIQQALTAELMRVESQSPIEAAELKEYQLAVKRIGELGGVKKLTEDVESQSAVDEAALLSAKKCVITTVTGLFCDHRLQGKHFDVVLVDDAAQLGIPYLAALALLANDSMTVAGDPFQLGPESVARTDLAQTWLQQDVFLTLAGTEQLESLYDWAQKQSRWCVPLTSRVAAAPKLSRFIASFAFNDRINVVERPGAKGSIVVLDTSDLKPTCRQYFGKKKLVPFNDVQTKRTVDAVKHILARGQRHASEIGVVVPIPGTALYTKLQIRMQGIRNVEIGTPATMQGRTKKAIVFDLTMAGVDYTMRHLDDRKIGEHRIMRMLNSVLSCVEEDLYIVADVPHFKSVYKDRLITKFLAQLQAQSEATPPLSASAKTFDEIGWDVREKLFVAPTGKSGLGISRSAEAATEKPRDIELEMRMKMLARQQPQVMFTGRDFDQETFLAVHRILGLRKDANLLSQMLGGDLLFRNSLGTEQAAARVPVDTCRNEDEFRKTMERWNLLIYEMSGAGKTDLTFFAKQTPEARVRWDINNLRAYYSSAMEAIIEESKHRIATSVNKVFQECLGKAQPANPVEWSTAYLNFLGKMEAYLAWISEQLRK
jgi:hypothetical protein